MTKLNEEWKIEPHGTLEQVAAGIWSVEGTIVMPLGKFPRRMTIVQLSSAGLAVWSPISLNESEMAKLDALGTIEFLIVPNAGHRLDLKAWKLRYPDARVVAPPGAVEDVSEAAPVDETVNVFQDTTVALERVKGTKADEFAMIITRDDGATLIINDILSSVSHPHGIGANIMARLFSFGVDHPQTSRLVRHMYVEDAREVAQQFRSWAAIPDLQRIIVSHVDIIDEDPASVLQLAADDLV